MLRAQRSNDCVLDSFSLSRVPPEVIISSTDYHGLVNLTSLDMRDNRLVMLTRGVEKLHRLTYLNLSYNDLYTVPAEVQELTQLTTLDVSHSALEAFPPGIGLMSQLINWEFDSNPKLRLPKNLLSFCSGFCAASDSASHSAPPPPSPPSRPRFWNPPPVVCLRPVIAWIPSADSSLASVSVDGGRRSFLKT
jgi:Leucine-rich repeat (LRR) protein